MHENLQSFFESMDSFLKVQFSAAEGSLSSEEVSRSHNAFIALADGLKFEDEVFDQARKRWIRLLSGMEANLGFPQLKNLNKLGSELAEHLEAVRRQIDSTSFLPLIRDFADQKFDDRGTALSVEPNSWLKQNNFALKSPVDPEAFKSELFTISGFDSSPYNYVFRPPQAGGFFMMALRTSPTFFIGHGRLDNFFGLSTFAHELGHSTTLQDYSLENYFINAPELNDEVLVNNEDDSYLYEKIFLENIPELSARLNLGLSGDLENLMIKRKAVQNNLHLIKNRMNYLYFAGNPLPAIESDFVNSMKAVFPSYAPLGLLDWVDFATVDQPLSRIGYLKAYQKVFAQ